MSMMLMSNFFFYLTCLPITGGRCTIDGGGGGG